MSMQVAVVPPQPSAYVDGYLIARTAPIYGIACRDGTFVDNIDLRRVIVFRTAKEAIQWAEATPRKWTMMNKGML